MERDIKSSAFKQDVHRRMMKFYAVCLIFGERNFARGLSKYIFPAINIDRPYPNNVKDWEVDCWIKANPAHCLAGFVKVHKLLGPQKFLIQLKEAGKEISDIASSAVLAGQFKGPEKRGR